MDELKELKDLKITRLTEQLEAVKIIIEKSIHLCNELERLFKTGGN